MIRLGLRLTMKGGREAMVRLIVTAVGVALGVGMVLITLAGINAVNAQNARYAWLETGAGQEPPVASPTSAPVWWLANGDLFHGQLIGRIDVATTGSTSPVPPGLSRLPGPGEFYASPALSKLLRSTPAAQLGDRYPGKQVGIIGAAALPAPNTLVIVIGHTPAQLAHVRGAKEITRISTTVPSSCNENCYFIGIDASGIDLVLSVAAAALLFPVLVFIGTASRLSAARREQRFAAMRLVGATPRQVSIVSAVESTVAAGAGVAAGFGLFFMVRTPLAGLPFTGAPFYPSDLSLSAFDMVLVAAGVPIAAAVAARLALRRVQISPLGVSRRVTPRPPRAWRLIPLFAGVGELWYFVGAGRPPTTPGEIEAYLTGFFLVMVGLISSGPWLTMLGSRLIARRTRRPAVLIAGRRLADNPKAGFRAISGLVLALFVTSVAIALITTIDAYDNPHNDPAEKATLVDQFWDFGSGPGVSPLVRSMPESLLEQLRLIPGVVGVTQVRADPSVSTESQGPPNGLVSCTELARTPALGRCAAGASVVSALPPFTYVRRSGPGPIWPAAAVAPGQLATLPVLSLAVGTDGKAAAIERARTVLERAYPATFFPQTIAESNDQNHDTKLNAQYRRLVDVVILASLPIAGCSLAVSVAAGLGDRKRPFALLRLTGTPIGVLRRVVGLETAVPLLAIAVISIGTGFLSAGLFLRSQLSECLQAPSIAYYFVVLAGLAG
ncbi:MAG TPA: FtsX-like permease family protein, partial [Frankiaceae bacterium]|nr:FtsX-like permease family protein [Frankiaceae bacterium]